MWNYYTNLTEPYEMRLVRQALSFSPDSSILSRHGGWFLSTGGGGGGGGGGEMHMLSITTCLEFEF